MSLFDDIDVREETEAVQDRQAMPGETLDRDGVSWVSNYDDLMSDEELDWSRKIRAQFKKKFVGGKYPKSWWPHMTTRDSRRMHLDGIADDDIASGQYDDTWSVRDFHDNPALSQFPSKLLDQIFRAWSFKEDKVFDPFAGHLSRPLLSNHFDRHYWGCDISKEYFDRTRNEILSRTEGGLLDDEVKVDQEEVVEVNLNDHLLRLERRDSREVDDIPDKWAEFVVTSPPYFDIEFYGDEDEQLGNANDEYEDFLDDMEQVLEHTHRILKPYHYAVFVVNDFRQDSSVNGLYPYHADLIKRAQNVGFQLHDLNMYKTGDSASLFAEQQVWMEATAKIHEYVITFRRWPDDWERDSNDKWPFRGVWWDIYPAEKIIDYYGIDRFWDWIEDRRDRGLSVDRWVDDEGNIQFEGHPKHQEIIEELSREHE